MKVSPGAFRFSAFAGIGPGSVWIEDSYDTSVGNGSGVLPRAELGIGYALADVAGSELAVGVHAMTHGWFWGAGGGAQLTYDFAP